MKLQIPGMRLRRRLLVDVRLQLSFVGFFVSLGAISIGVVYYANYLFFNKILLEAKILGLPPTHYFYQFLEAQRDVMGVIFFLTSLVILSSMVLGGLILSNRVAGPLLRLTEHMRKASRGVRDLTAVKFRKGDYFQDVADACNDVVDRLYRDGRGGAEPSQRPHESGKAEAN